MEIQRYRNQILEAMGLGSSLAAALVGCGEPGAITPRLEEGAVLSQAILEGGPPSERIQVPATLDLSVSTFEVDRVATVELSGAVGGSQVALVWSQRSGSRCPPRLGGVCLDMGGPVRILEVLTADPSGEITANVNIPGGLPDGSDLLFQAVAEAPDGTLDRSVLVQGAVSHPVRSCPERPEVDPDLQPADIAHRSRWLVCTDLPLNGTCDPSSSFGRWEGDVMFSDALGEALPPNWNVVVQCDETSTVDRCCYQVKANDTSISGGGGGGGGGWEGRPFVVGGENRIADPRGGEGWSEDRGLSTEGLEPRIADRIVARWLGTAAAEHASVASFSRFNLELLSLGAPSSLLAASTRAIGDEIRHARIAYGVASALSGRTFAPSPLPIDSALDRSRDPGEVLVAAILEGCINETICALQLRAAIESVEDPALAASMRGVAEDETRHSELSWTFVRWMLEARPELRPLAARTFDLFALGPAPARDPDRDALARFGVASGADDHEVAVRVLREVIRPCADALLGRSGSLEAAC